MLDSRRVAGVALLLLPAGLMAYFAFNSGGFFPAAPAYVAMLLALVLAIRIVGSEAPFAGIGWQVGLASGAMALFALLTLVSEAWSHAPGLSLVTFDRALLYTLVLALFGSIARTRLRLAWTLRVLAVAIVVVCTCGLITRLLPHVWPTTPDIANNRLSFPVTYWNVLGLLAAFGIILCLHFTSDEREPPIARIAGAVGIPLLASTLYFTFSRGSIATCLVIVLVYAVVAHPRGLLSAALSVVPSTAVALTFAYDANLLATMDPTTAGAVRQGHRVAIAVAACAVVAGLIRAALAKTLDPRIARIVVAPEVRRRNVRVGWAVLAVAAVSLLIAFSGQISHEYHQFLKPAPPGNASDLRARLTDPGNNGRLETWRIAWHEFQAKPLLGQGAGTFKDAFAQHRTTSDFVLNAHSLYLETLDELGIVGLIVLLAAILTILVVSATRIRGPDRALYASAFALLLGWALESGIDWDWQMPVVTTVVFALGGLVLARPLRTGEQRAQRSGVLAPHLRTAVAVGCLLLAVAPAYVWLSQRKLNQANTAFSNGNWRAATDDALSSISILGIQAQAYELVAYSDIHRSLPGLAIQAMQKAEKLDPNDWNYAYGMALMRAAAGLNPLAAARRALHLNPREPLVQNEWQVLSTDTPSQWPSDARTIADAFTSL